MEVLKKFLAVKPKSHSRWVFLVLDLRRMLRGNPGRATLGYAVFVGLLRPVSGEAQDSGRKAKLTCE